MRNAESCQLGYFYFALPRRMTKGNTLQTMKKMRQLSRNQELRSESILRNRRWLNVTNSAKRVRKDEGGNWTGPWA